MNEFDSIIFDLDGTLWSTIDSCVKSISKVKNKYSDIIYDISVEEVKSSMGLPFDEIVKKYYGYIEKEKAVKYTKEAFDTNINNLLENGGNLYPKMQDTIKELSQSFKLFIVSNCVEGYIESFLSTSMLNEYFCDYESNGRTKLSKGENIKLIIERNNLKKSIYVGDTISDKMAAEYAKIPFVYASYGFGNVTEYDYKINHINDLLTIFD